MQALTSLSQVSSKLTCFIDYREFSGLRSFKNNAIKKRNDFLLDKSRLERSLLNLHDTSDTKQNRAYLTLELRQLLKNERFFKRCISPSQLCALELRSRGKALLREHQYLRPADLGLKEIEGLIQNEMYNSVRSYLAADSYDCRVTDLKHPKFKNCGCDYIFSTDYQVKYAFELKSTSMSIMEDPDFAGRIIDEYHASVS